MINLLINNQTTTKLRSIAVNCHHPSKHKTNIRCDARLWYGTF